jgi:hypothetical protein
MSSRDNDPSGDDYVAVEVTQAFLNGQPPQEPVGHDSVLLKFEAFAKADGYDLERADGTNFRIPKGSYLSNATTEAWSVWQACAASFAAEKNVEVASISVPPAPGVSKSIDHDAFWVLVAQCRDAKPGEDYRSKSARLVKYVDQWSASSHAAQVAQLMAFALTEAKEGMEARSATDSFLYSNACEALAAYNALVSTSGGQPENTSPKFDRKWVMEAWACVRNNNSRIPDDVLDAMRDTLLAETTDPAPARLGTQVGAA